MIENANRKDGSMTPQATLIEAVLQAPPERQEAILSAARGPAPQKPKPITAKAAADILGTCSRTIFRYAERGQLHAIRLSPRMIRFDANEVEGLLSGKGA
jgi:hypothetical protein